MPPILFVLWLAARVSLPWLIESRLQAVHRAGYPVTLAELDQWYPKVSGEPNGAELYGAAFAKLAGGPGWVPSSIDRLMDSTSTGTPLTQEVKRSMAGSLANKDRALGLLHQAAALKQSRYPLDLSRLSILPYSHLGSLRWSAHLLQIEAVHYADDQNPTMAVRSVISLLGLARSLATEPLLRSDLARIDCQQITTTGLEQVLNRVALSEADLYRLIVALDEADDPQSLTRAFAGQRCIGIYGFDTLSPATDPSLSPVERSHPLWLKLVIYPILFIRLPSLLYYPSGLMDWDKLRYLQFMDCYVAATKTAFPERIAMAESLQGSLARMPKFHILTRQWVQNMNGLAIILKDAVNTARLRAARTAVAVERYRLAHGQPPPTLAALVPLYLDAVPADPFDPAGAGLRYRKLTKGYVVFSVGTDAEDNNGDRMKDVTFAVAR